MRGSQGGGVAVKLLRRAFAAATAATRQAQRRRICTGWAIYEFRATDGNMGEVYRFRQMVLLRCAAPAAIGCNVARSGASAVGEAPGHLQTRRYARHPSLRLQDNTSEEGRKAVAGRTPAKLRVQHVDHSFL